MSFKPTRDTIIYRALRMVGAYASSSVPRPEQVSDALDVLNMLLKSWQVDNHLWLKKFATLDLVAGQSKYKLGGDSTDTCTYDDTGTQVDRPFKIFSATRKSAGTESPLALIARQDYHEIANKTAEGKVTRYYYDPQLSAGTLYVWPVPDSSDDQIVLSLDRPIEDVLADSDSADMPHEWVDALCYALALRLAPEYGVGIAERQLLDVEYASFMDALSNYDREDASIFFTVAR